MSTIIMKRTAEGKTAYETKAQDSGAKIDNEQDLSLLQMETCTLKPKKLSEEVKLREPHSKWFRLDDGTLREEIHSLPIHFYSEEEARYLNIDNRLQESPMMRAIADDFDGYANRQAKAFVKFAKRTDEARLFTVRKGGHSLSWSFHQREQMPTFANATLGEQTQEEGRLLYPEVLPGVDFNYLVNSICVKENIVIKQRLASYQFCFDLTFTHLDLELAEDQKSLSFFIHRFDEETGELFKETVFRIPAPYLYDAAGQTGNEAHYELERQDNEHYLFTILADPAWINAPERQFPVVIDPVITIDEPKEILTFACLNAQNKVQSDSDKGFSVGTYSDDTYRTFFKLKLPVSPSNQRVTHVGMELRSLKNAEERTLEVHRCHLRDLSEVSFQQPYDDALIDVIKEEFLSTSEHELDLTKLFSDRATQTAYFVLKERDEQTVRSSFCHFGGPESYKITPLYQNLAPVITVDYLSEEMVTSDQALTQGALRAGNGTVDLFQGNLTFVHDDFQLTGNRMPLNLSHVFNLTQSDWLRTWNPICLGKGWKLNLQQYLIPATSAGYDDSANVKYLYVDAGGKEHPFIQSDTEGLYVDELGSNLELRCDTADLFSTITDLNGNHLQFYFHRLSKITSIDGSQMTIGYDLFGRVDHITDGIGRTAKFYYQTCGCPETECNSLDQIVCGSKKITFVYEGERLGKIRYWDNHQLLGESRYQYDSFGRLKSAQDMSGYGVAYEYEKWFNRVSKIKEFSDTAEISENGVLSLPQRKEKNLYELKYLDSLQTVVQSATGVKKVFHFNQRGSCITHYEDKQNNDANSFGNFRGVVQFNDYLSNENAIHRLQISFDQENLMHATSFEAGSDGWRLCRYRAQDCIVCGESVEGDCSYCLTGEFEEEKGLVRTFNKDCFEHQHSYVFSAWTKANAKASGQYLLRAKVNYFDRASVVTECNYDSACIDWQFGAVAFQIESLDMLQNVELSVVYSHNINEVRIDNIALTQGNFQRITTEPFLVANGKKYSVLDIVKLKVSGWNIEFSLTEKNRFVTYRDIEIMRKKVYISMKNCTEVYVCRGTAILVFSDNVEIGVKNIKMVYGGDITIADGTNTLSLTKNVLNQITSQVVSGTENFAVGISYESTAQAQGNQHRLLGIQDFRDIVTEFQYQGQRTTAKTYWAGNDDPVKQLMTTTENTGDGNYLSKFFDERYPLSDNVYRQIHYDQETGNLVKIRNQEGHATEFTYDGADNLIRVSAYVDNRLVQNNLTYTKNLLTRVACSEGVTYHLKYDGFGMLKEVRRNDDLLLTQSYDDESKYTSEIVGSYNYTETTYAGGDCIRTYYDQYDREVEVDYNGVRYAENIYDVDSGRLLSHKDHSSGGTVTHDFVYDPLTHAISHKTVAGNGHSGRFDYQYAPSTNQLQRMDYEIDGIYQRMELQYDCTDNGSIIPDFRILRTKYRNNRESPVDLFDRRYGYDDPDQLGRLTSVDVFLGGNALIARQQFRYQDVKDYCDRKISACDTIAGMTVEYGTSRITKDYSYEYDYNGNLRQVQCGQTRQRYAYDDIERLTREDSDDFGRTTLFTYDDFGNLKAKKVYSLTFQNVPAGSYQSLVYRYDTACPERLLQYGAIALDTDSQVPAYDVQGNPNRYFNHRGGGVYQCTWSKGMLTRLAATDSEIQYTYNSAGLRSSKTVNGTKTEYFYEGNQLLREVTGDRTISYFYDQTGVCGMEQTIAGGTRTVYHFLKSLQGDVSALLDSKGNLVAEYQYDAWGKMKIIAEINGIRVDIANNAGYNTHIARLNSFRYRSYQFDEETAWYYLKNRYYDPEVGRFLNSDDLYYLDPYTINGYNLYCYCNNNPIRYCDLDGHEVVAAIGKAAAILSE